MTFMVIGVILYLSIINLMFQQILRTFTEICHKVLQRYGLFEFKVMFDLVDAMLNLTLLLSQLCYLIRTFLIE